MLESNLFSNNAVISELAKSHLMLILFWKYNHFRLDDTPANRSLLDGRHIWSPNVNRFVERTNFGRVLEGYYTSPSISWGNTDREITLFVVVSRDTKQRIVFVDHSRKSHAEAFVCRLLRYCVAAKAKQTCIYKDFLPRESFHKCSRYGTIGTYILR